MPGDKDEIDYVTIASAGNATDFGDLSAGKGDLKGFDSSTRSVFMGGYIGPAYINIMEYVTTSSTGDVTDFGDLTEAIGLPGCTGNSTRGVRGGGAGEDPQDRKSDVVDYVTIASTGDAADFGDLTAGVHGKYATSNGHGGLS